MSGPHTAEGWVLQLAHERLDLEASELHVLIVLAARHNRDYRVACPKLDRLAAETHLSKRQVLRIIDDLSASSRHGGPLLHVSFGPLPIASRNGDGRKAQGNSYRFVGFDPIAEDLPPRRKEVVGQGSAEDSNSGDTMTPEEVTPRHLNSGDTMSPHSEKSGDMETPDEVTSEQKSGDTGDKNEVTSPISPLRTRLKNPVKNPEENPEVLSPLPPSRSAEGGGQKVKNGASNSSAVRRCKICRRPLPRDYPQDVCKTGDCAAKARRAAAQQVQPAPT